MSINSQPDLSRVMQQVLTPVLQTNVEELTVGEMSAALELARAGIALSGEQADWLDAIDQRCAQLQKHVTLVLRAQRIPETLHGYDVPKLLKPAAKNIRKLARREHKLLSQQLLQWLQGEQGDQCRAAIKKALKKGRKVEPLRVSEAQLTAALHCAEVRLAKWQKKSRQKADVQAINKQGRAAQKLRLYRQFASFFGHHVVSDEYLSDVSRYRAFATQHGTGRWLELLLEQALRGNKQSAAAGVMWAQSRAQSQKIMRDMFVASVPNKILSANFPTARLRTDFPLRLRFGVIDKASKA